MAAKSKLLAVRDKIEVLRPVEPDMNNALERMVERKLAEMMGDSQNGIFEPFFQAKAIAHAIRKLETVPQQRKWQGYFAKWGCLICARTNVKHNALGMCIACHQRTHARLADVLGSASDERPEQQPVRDLQDVARQALRAASSSDGKESLSVATGIPLLEVETRPYVTTAERMAQQGTTETLQRAKTLRFEEGLTWKEVTRRLDPKGFAIDPKRATERVRMAVHNHLPPDVRKLGQAKIAQRRQEKSARRKEMWRQARTLHVEKNLTWREIAQRLDPDFDKNPKAAIARIEMGAHRVSPVRDVTNLARAAVRKS